MLTSCEISMEIEKFRDSAFKNNTRRDGKNRNY